MDPLRHLAYHLGMTGPLGSLQRLGAHLAERRRRARFARALTPVLGPAYADVAPDEVLLICVLRNGAGYLPAFLEHYRALGVMHFAFLDTGSEDATEEILAGEEGVILDRCPLPPRQYLDLMRNWAAARHGRDRWCLNVEVDELLDFEGSATLGLSGLIAHLEGVGANALLAQRIELFPKAPRPGPVDLRQALAEDLYFDLGPLERHPYQAAHPLAALCARNEALVPGLEMFFAPGATGARCLTRHPLVLNEAGVTLSAHPNVPTGLRCGDLTGVLRAYPFARQGMRDSPFSLAARRWTRVALLERVGLMTASPAYRAHFAAARP